MKDLEQLRRAVIDNPDDDGARKVFADALLERGDLRGELINLQLEQLVRPGINVEWRIDTILSRNWQACAGAAAPYMVEGSFKRGFVDAVRMKVDAFEKDGEQVFSTEPVRQLQLATKKIKVQDLERFAATPALRWVRALRLQFHRPNARPKVPLAALGGRLSSSTPAGTSTPLRSYPSSRVGA